MIDYESALIKHKFKYKKAYGQNFIFDDGLLDEIAALGGADGAVVVEIGAGSGSLTRAIAKRAKRVVSFEIDEELFPILNETLDGFDNVSLLNYDVTTLGIENVDALIGEPYIVIANLPYYITTQLLFLFLRSELCGTVTCLVQKEVAERICAKSGGSFGALSASVQSVSEPSILKVIKSWDFYPQPEVDSALVRLDRKGGTSLSDDPDRFFKACFAQKRKTLVNNLTAVGIDKGVIVSALAGLGFSPSARAEELGTENLLKMYKLVSGA